MAQKFNPLLKIGLQEIGRDYSTDISTLQNAINSLQSQANALQTALNTLKGNKITKCFTAADLAKLEDNEIFEWQGASGTVDETAFVNGYFYKKTFLPATVQVLILYHNYAYINGEYLADTYYYSHSEDPGLMQYNSTRNIDNKSVVWIGDSTPNVGDLVTISIGESSQSFVTITNKEIVDLQFRYTDSNGDVWSLNGSVYSRAITYNYYTNSQGVTINVNWDSYFDNMGFVCSDNGKLYLVRWTNYGSTGAKFDTVVNPEGSASYSATDTQPQPAAATTSAAGLMSAADKTKLDGIAQNANNYSLPTAAANVLGGVKVGSGLDIDESGILSVAAGDNLKVPRCFSQAQIANLSANDIFQWQGETSETLTNGYFYKITRPAITIQPGTKYYKIVNDVVLYGTTFVKAGEYYLVENLPSDYLDNGVFTQLPQNGTYFAYTLAVNNYRPIAGDLVFNKATNEYLSVESIDGDNYTLFDGENTVVVDFSSWDFTNPMTVTRCVALDQSSIIIAPLIVNANGRLPVACEFQGVWLPVVLEPNTEWQLLETSEPIILPFYDNVQPSLKWGTIDDYECLVAKVPHEGVSSPVEIPIVQSFQSPKVWVNVNFVSGVTLANYSGACYFGLKYFRVMLKSANDIAQNGKLADCEDLINTDGGFSLFALDDINPPVFVSLFGGTFYVNSQLKKNVYYSGIFISFSFV